MSAGELYTVIYTSDDGDTTIELLLKSELERRINEKYYGKSTVLHLALGARVDLQANAGLWLIPGHPVLPVEERVVVKRTLP